MSVAAVLLPLFVLVAILFVLLLPIRKEPASPGAIDGRSLTLALLFSILTVLALFTHKGDIIFLVLAWIFVATRAFALFPALAGSAVKAGRTMDLVSTLVLAVMWVLFAAAILLNV